MVTGPVGLLSYYEYVKSYSKASFRTGYLNNAYYWWLISPPSSSQVRYVYYDGDIYKGDMSYLRGVRPTVNLKSGVQNSGGDGSKENPYVVNGDISEPNKNELLNRRVSGEYVIFDNELYRIVNIENKITKITKVDYIRENDTVLKKSLSSSVKYGTGTDSKYWDYFLNNNWYNEISDDYRQMIVKNDWYLGIVGSDTSNNYKNSICKTQDTIETTKYCKRTDDIYNNYVGLGRIGEMFTSQIGNGYSTSIDIWTITLGSSSDVRYLNNYGTALSDFQSYWFGVRPSLNLSSDVKIKSGAGTVDSPFEITM